MRKILLLLLLCSNLSFASQPLPIPIEPPTGNWHGSIPQPNRTEEFRRFLAPSLRVRYGNYSGSATIIYYDKTKNTAWAMSCGHFWKGTSNKPVDITLTAFYHNNKKLDKPKEYKGKVHFHYNNYANDISLISFQPDWEPYYFAIAPLDYELFSQNYHSTGCDGGEEVAHYSVQLISQDQFYVTVNNSPRPGRSGGGLLTDDGYYVGICVRTSDVSGNGNGYFVTLPTIHTIMEKEGFGWLLKQSAINLARKIPIIDINNPQREYKEDYIPLPIL